MDLPLSAAGAAAGGGGGGDEAQKGGQGEVLHMQACHASSPLGGLRWARAGARCCAHMADTQRPTPAAPKEGALIAGALKAGAPKAGALLQGTIACQKDCAKPGGQGGSQVARQRTRVSRARPLQHPLGVALLVFARDLQAPRRGNCWLASPPAGPTQQQPSQQATGGTQAVRGAGGRGDERAPGRPRTPAPFGPPAQCEPRPIARFPARHPWPPAPRAQRRRHVPAAGSSRGRPRHPPRPPCPATAPQALACPPVPPGAAAPRLHWKCPARGRRNVSLWHVHSESLKLLKSLKRAGGQPPGPPAGHEAALRPRRPALGGWRA